MHRFGGRETIGSILHNAELDQALHCRFNLRDVGTLRDCVVHAAPVTKAVEHSDG